MTRTSVRREIARVVFDADDPYADVDTSMLPEWWRNNILEFSDHDLPTYLPSLFADGAIVQSQIDHLERRHDVVIQLISPNESRDWEIRIDGATVETVEKRRTGKGYSVFQMTSNLLEALARESLVD